MIAQIKQEINSIEEFIKTQPSANDLNSCDTFLRELHVKMCYLSDVSGYLETEINRELIRVLKDKELEAEVKLIKNSSTVFMNYVQGRVPEESTLFLKCKSLIKVLETIRLLFLLLNKLSIKILI